MIRPRSVLLGTVSALAVLATGWASGVTLAAFSATTSNTGNSFSSAPSFCTSPGTQTVMADADSYVDEQQPNNNFGSSTSLRVQSRGGGRNQRALVHFPFPVAPFCAVTSATLRLSTGSGDAGRTLQAYQVATAWTEGTATWATQPLTVGSPSTTTSAAGWVQFDVTAQTQSLFSGLNSGFLVKDAAESQNPPRSQQFRSREASSDHPELVITLG